MLRLRGEPNPVRGVFGKVPSAPDFIRAGGTTVAIEAFLSWLADAVGWTTTRRPETWTQADPGALWGFLLRPPATAKSAGVVAGVLAASRDAVGRRFPLAVYCEIAPKSAGESPHVLPLAVGAFLEDAAALLGNADSAYASGQLDRALDAIGMPSAQDIAAQAAEYDEWARGTALSTAWAAIHGEDAPAAAIPVLDLVMAGVSPWRGQELPTTQVSLKLPLGAGGSAAAAFWLDIVRKAAGWKRTIPTCFWSSQPYSGALLVQIGDTPPTSLSELWAPHPESDQVCDLTRGTTVQGPVSLEPRLAGLLQSPDTSVSELLSALQRGF